MVTKWDDVIQQLVKERSKFLKPKKAGNCDTCGEFTGRLYNGMCEPCIEKYAPDEIARRAGV